MTEQLHFHMSIEIWDGEILLEKIFGKFSKDEAL